MIEVTNEDIKELKEKFEKVRQQGWIESIKKGPSSVGIMFEKLIGIERNSFAIPDYEGIEIKTKTNTTKYDELTLFNAVPDSYLMEIPRLVESYGYPDKDLPQYKVLNINVSAAYNKIISGRYHFKLNVDYEKENVYLNVLDIRTKDIDSDTAWSFDLLKEHLYRKLKYLAFVNVDRKFEHGIVYFKYSKITFYKLSNFEQFLKLLETGYIEVGFTIGVHKTGEKKGKINNHGTRFCIKIQNLDKLFTKLTDFE